MCTKPTLPSLCSTNGGYFLVPQRLAPILLAYIPTQISEFSAPRHSTLTRKSNSFLGIKTHGSMDTVSLVAFTPKVKCACISIALLLAASCTRVFFRAAVAIATCTTLAISASRSSAISAAKTTRSWRALTSRVLISPITPTLPLWCPFANYSAAIGVALSMPRVKLSTSAAFFTVT